MGVLVVEDFDTLRKMVRALIEERCPAAGPIVGAGSIAAARMAGATPADGGAARSVGAGWRTGCDSRR